MDGERVASRLGVALVGVALGPQGHDFFFLPCPARGVVRYVYAEGGLETRFEGCDLGDGVVVEGTGRLFWSDPRPASETGERFCGFMRGPGLPTCPDALRWNGDLEVRVDGAPAPPLKEIRITDLVIRDRGARFPEDLDFRSGVMGLASMSVSLWDSRFAVTDPSLPGTIFAPTGLTLESIPNPGGALEAWSEADVARLTWDAAYFLARWLLDETMEINRGAHAHDLGCGTLEMVVEEGMPIAHADWRGCAWRGLVWTGRFRLRWNQIEERVYDLVLDGELEVGGALPRTTIERLRWRAEREYPRSLRITGEIEGSEGRRPFSYELTGGDSRGGDPGETP